MPACRGRSVNPAMRHESDTLPAGTIAFNSLLVSRMGGSQNADGIHKSSKHDG
ncbi:hypothetical protein B0G80_8737 [Paraburkholderia sp. BL6669N2]|nr:hypothetical protein B0G80_8737 [Paraburkholderia sp. BL6669N2]